MLRPRRSLPRRHELRLRTHAARVDGAVRPGQLRGGGRRGPRGRRGRDAVPSSHPAPRPPARQSDGGALGIADFRRRSGREPEGMWLPETAVDDETLDVLAAEGIRFTILTPPQVERVPAGGRPGWHRTAGGRSIALFLYDGALSH